MCMRYQAKVSRPVVRGRAMYDVTGDVITFRHVNKLRTGTNLAHAASAEVAL